MDNNEPPVDQIMIVWRDLKWSVFLNGHVIADYARRPDALLRARRLSADCEDAGRECYMLERDKEGRWTEHPCPRPLRDPA
jgi:hypothetical protein